MAALELFRSILKAGWADVATWPGQRQESLHLEFKAKDRNKGTGNRRFSAQDKDHVGKALSGFANTEGGVVVLGVHAKRQDSGPDVVQNVDAIEDIDNFESDVRERIIDIIEPPVAGILIDKIRTTTDPTRGIVLIYIPESVIGPHRVVNCSSELNHRFYKRSDQHTYPMPYKDLSTMFGRRPAAALGLTFFHRISRGRQQVEVQLRNEGRGYAERPAIRFFQYMAMGDKIECHDLNWHLFRPANGWAGVIMTSTMSGGPGYLVRANSEAVLYPGMEVPVGFVEGDLKLRDGEFSLVAHGVVYALNLHPIPFSICKLITVGDRLGDFTIGNDRLPTGTELDR